MNKFKSGDHVRIVGMSLRHRIFGMKNYKGVRMFPPKTATVICWRGDLDAYEVRAHRVLPRVQLFDTWYFIEEKLRPAADPTKAFSGVRS